MRALYSEAELQFRSGDNKNLRKGEFGQVIFGINTNYTKDKPFEERIRLIKNAGFASVMLFWEGSDVFEEQVLCVKQNGLRIESVHAPFHIMNELWTDERPVESLIRLHGAIDSCHNFAIKTLVVHPTDGIDPPPVSACGKLYFQGLIRYAKSMNVDLAFENIQHPEYLDVIFTECDDENVKLCYDVGHENCFSKGREIPGVYAGRLKTLHIHDNDGTCDQHAIPFDASIDFERFIKKLKDCNYYGVIALEVMKHYSDLYNDMTDEQFLARAFEAAKRLFEMRQG